MAIANDNFHGYTSDLLTRWKVRWIEAAVAMPFWTVMLVYYVEGDKGHLMEEETMDQKRRTGARGNIVSYQLPWEAILGQLGRSSHDCMEDEDLAHMPRDPDELARFVKLHVKQGFDKAVPALEEVRVRTHVVLKIGRFLIKQRHESFRGNKTATDLLQRFEEKVQKFYPEQEANVAEVLRQGRVPGPVQEAMQATLRKPPLPGTIQPQKNATPAEGSVEVSRVFLGVRPHTMVVERSSKNVANPGEQLGAALEKADEMSITTGASMVPQWETQYFSRVFPFVMPRMVGGPEFSPLRRWRRRGDAAFVTLKQWTKGIVRRAEGQFRSDWAFIPAIWNCLFRFTAVQAVRPGVSAKHLSADRNRMQNAEELRETVRELHDKLNKGTYGDIDHPRPIAKDFTKLLMAHGLSDKAKQFINRVNMVSSQIPGTQQIRKRMNHAIFGGRVVHGECLFITISPSERHSGLRLRLTRLRRHDPLLEGDERWKQWKACAGPDGPSLEETAHVDLPNYEFRRLQSCT
jgi:hypothetical protein